MFSGVCFSFGSWAREQRLVEAAPPHESVAVASPRRGVGHTDHRASGSTCARRPPRLPHTRSSFCFLFGGRSLCFAVTSAPPTLSSPTSNSQLSPQNSASSVALPCAHCSPAALPAFSSSHPPSAASRLMTRLLPPARGPFPFSPLRVGFSVTATAEFRLCSSPLGPWPSLPGTCAWVFIGADSSATPLHFHLKIKREKLRSDLARSPSLARAELISFLAVPWALCPRRDYSSDPTHQGRVRVCLSI